MDTEAGLGCILETFWDEGASFAGVSGYIALVSEMASVKGLS